MSRVVCRAPGKVVAFGEYAVLAGATAGIMAIDAYAEVQVARSKALSVSSQGFEAEPLVKQSAQFSNQPVAAMLEAMLYHLGYREYPEPLQIQLDTQAFYRQGVKIGIGSSAALCVALYRALCEYLNRAADVAEAMAIHFEFQGQSGSGSDVAASWHKGYIHFRDGQSTSTTWPENLHYAFVWTHASASTEAHLASFSQWRANADQAPLTSLCEASEAVASNTSIATLENYVAALQTLDNQANLGIYTDAHSYLTNLATQNGVVYKPCGAGGGDVGMAISDDEARLKRFLGYVRSQYTVLPMRLAE